MTADRITITIELGNDAMSEWRDVARLLKSLADRVKRDLAPAGPPFPCHSFTMRDDNGNTVARIDAE